MLSIKKIKFERASISRGEKPHQISAVNPKQKLITGKEAQEFYERVISHPSRKRKKSCKKQFVVKVADKDCNQKNHRDPNILFKLAQEGKLKQIKQLFYDKYVCDVNAMDNFGWTALMCSACAGHSMVIQYLLQKGANKELTNRNGQTAFDLAKAKKATQVMRILKSWNKKECEYDLLAGPPENEDHARNVEKRIRNKFFCVACARYFTETSIPQHQTSMVHLFNITPKQKETWYHINESNKGYRMLLQDGWDKEKGLGPEGKEGQKFPVKTVLKRDRKCLGTTKTEDSTPRVTHFKPYELSAVEKPKVETRKINLKRLPKETTANKRRHEKKRRKEKEWERDFRRSFSLE